MEHEAGEAEENGFRGWCIVELFGHQRLAGYVSERKIAGHGFVRIDVPETSTCPAYSKFLGASAVYAMTPVDEVIAKEVAKDLKEQPISVFELRKFLADWVVDQLPSEKRKDDDLPF